MIKYRSLVSSFAEFSAYGLPGLEAGARLVEVEAARRLKRAETKRSHEEGFTFGQSIQELTRKTALVRTLNDTVSELLSGNGNLSGSAELYDSEVTFATSVANVTLPTAQEPIQFYRHSFALTVVFCIAYITIFVVGLIGNMFVIAVVYRSPRMRNVTNYFIVNLAIADMLVVILCLPATLLSNIFVPWVLGWYMCKVVPYVQGVSVAASVYSLIAVSIDRFLAIWWPLKCQITTRRARIIITGIWLVSIATTLPWALYFDLVIVFEDVPEIQVCLEKWPNPLVGLLYFLIVNLFFSYLLPMAIITASYILIWVRVGKRNIPTDAKDAALERMQQKSKMKVIKMLVAVVILFAFSWLPLYIIFGWIKVTGETGTELLQTLTPIAQWLGASNSCINPILYACFNKKFRKGFMELIRSWKICAPLRKYETVAMASSSTSTRKGSALGPHGAVLRRQTTHDSCYITSSAALRRQTSQETYLVNDDGRILPRQASQDSSTFGSERGGILKRQTSNDSNSMRVSKPISTVVGVLARAGSGDSSTSRTRFSTKTDSISEEATGDFTADFDGFTTSVSNSVDIEDITPEQIDAITNANTNANALTAMEFETSVVNGFIPAGSISKAPLVQVHSFPRAKGIPRMAPRRQMSHETRVSFMYECTRV